MSFCSTDGPPLTGQPDHSPPPVEDEWRQSSDSDRSDSESDRSMQSLPDPFDEESYRDEAEDEAEEALMTAPPPPPQRARRKPG